MEVVVEVAVGVVVVVAEVEEVVEGVVEVAEAEEAGEVVEVVEEDDLFESPSGLFVSHIISYRVVSLHKPFAFAHSIQSIHHSSDVPDADRYPQNVLPNANPTPTGPFLVLASLPTVISPSVFGSCSFA